jgi:hypothetical protein
MLKFYSLTIQRVYNFTILDFFNLTTFYYLYKSEKSDLSAFVGSF